MSERVLLGRITGAHGLKGEVKIATFTAAPRIWQPMARYQARMARASFEIASLRGSGGAAVIARLLGVADRNERRKPLRNRALRRSRGAAAGQRG